ncbi:hypothetical protein LOTGIDRAFT_227929 [Lottia gigantea]|uniref:Uncharacterized protein n=1 Tax=Lottia gigantea TaxID=225164 RepID=V4BH66_LOTGI|nr:hypothetical protein LOTGIDRAFT_227929 [Lottia gigantea]ESP05297.1 hypothetical protein LOTGIDRAFT_227929 [Lottia gigantea]
MTHKMAGGMTMMVEKPPVHGHLGPGNFTISQEDALTNPAMCSVFQKHYVSHPEFSRSQPAKPPVLGPVMHKDKNYFNELLSETYNSYEYRPGEKMVLEDVHTKLSATNFKMDRDLSKFNSFNTTSGYYFVPKITTDFERAKPIFDLESHVPNGDPGKAPAPVSDYREKFEGHDTSVVKVHKAPAMHEGGPPTIKGDPKYDDFKTSHSLQFPYKWQKRLASVYPATGTSVPNGDTEKIVLRDTTMSTSFPPVKGAENYASYNHQDVSHILRQTNFKQSDGRNTWNDYKSTANSDYQNKGSIKFQRAAPSFHRNHSDFPPGDRENDTERVNMTTSKYHHGNPALGLHNTIRHGADVLTKSNVLFGEPRVRNPMMYYSTTNTDEFLPKSAPYTYFKSKYYTNSSVPIKYYKNEVANTTSQTDYNTPCLVDSNGIDLEAIEKLKRSNFFPPWKGETCFNTTHQDMFTPKPMEKYVIDSGKMQKSSVPLGTLSISTQK